MSGDMIHIVGALLGAGWDETRLGKCHEGDKVLLMPENAAPTILDVIKTDTEDSSVVTSDGASYSPREYALRAPRFEYPTGTVALIRSYGEPVRAWRDRDVWHTENGEIVFGDRATVARVLLPVDADTPKVTDEMVWAARQAEADWDASETPLDEYPPGTQVYQFRAEIRKMRTILEAALAAM